MSTRFEYPDMTGNGLKWLRCLPTENGAFWDNGSGPPSFGYTTILDNGSPLPQRNDLDFIDYFTVTDNGSETRVNIDVVALGGDSTFVTTIANNSTFVTTLVNNNTFTTALAGDTNFITNLVANNTFTTNLANNSNFYTTLANNTSFITALTSNSNFITSITNIVNNDPSIQIDLASQVTGVLPLANGGTGAALSAPAGNRLFFYDVIDGSSVFVTLGSGLSYDHVTHTLSATGGGSGSSLSVPVTQASHGFPVGQAIAVRLTAGGVYVESLALKTSSTDLQSEIIGLAVATSVNDFDLYYGGLVPTTDFSLLDEGTPLYLSDTTPGEITDVEPTATNTVSKPIGYVNVPGTDIVMYNYRGLVNFEDSLGAKSVNADVTEDTWFTTQIDAPRQLTTGLGWTLSIAGGAIYANGTHFGANGGFTAITTNGFLAQDNSNAALKWDDTIALQLKWRASGDVGTGTSGSGIYQGMGFSSQAIGAGWADITNTADKRVGFGFYNGNIYAIVCDGSNITANVVRTYASIESLTYGIIYDPGVSVEFYIDGLLVDTITTNLPTGSSGTDIINISLGGTNTGGGGSSIYSTHFILGQKTS